MSKKRKTIFRKIITFLVFIVILGISGWMGRQYIRKLRIVPVTTQKITRDTFLHTVTSTSTGTLKAERKAKISSQIKGRVTRVGFTDGEQVKSGETIIFLDSLEAEANVVMAKANLLSANVKYEQMKMAYELEKKLVHSKINETKANRKEAESYGKRAKDLNKQGVYSVQQLDTAERNLDVAKEAHNAAVANQEKIALKEKEMLSAKANVKQVEAALRMARIQEKYVTIKAPFNGIIYNKNVELGEMVMPGSILMEIVDNNSIYIHATIDEADIYKIKLDQTVSITIDAFPNSKFSGVLYDISPIISEEKQEGRTAAVKISLAPHEETLRPGMSCDIEILIDEIHDVLMAPTNLIMGRGNEKYVYVANSGKVKKRSVDLGISNWDFSIIKKGLREGEEIISSIDKRQIKEGKSVVIKNE